MVIRLLAGSAFTLAVTIIGVALSPFYLQYETPIDRSDAVIVLVGAEDGAKLRKALWLMDSGYFRYLLIPGKGYSCDALENDCIESTSKEVRLAGNELEPEMESSRIEDLPWYRERTHQELIMARQMMEKRKLNSAIVISQPYHMRRIRLITSTVFKNQPVRLHYMPAETIHDSDAFRWSNPAHLEWAVSEYQKIGWFMLYAWTFEPAI